MANEKRLIDANKLWVALDMSGLFDDGNPRHIAQGTVEEQPTVDAVPTGVLDQVRWERDVAIEQLKDHGIPFGGIAPDVVKVVRCKDCNYRGDAMNCPMCFEETSEWDDDGYMEVDYITHDQTVDDGFCDRGERSTEDDE